MSNSHFLKRSPRIDALATESFFIAFEDRSFHLLGRLAGIPSLKLQRFPGIPLHRKPARGSDLLENCSRAHALASHGLAIAFSNCPLLSFTHTRSFRLAFVMHIHWLPSALSPPHATYPSLCLRSFLR